MFAGEIWVICASVSVSTKPRETLEDAAPTTTDGWDLLNCRALPRATERSLESPESRMLWHASTPLTPPAALMSETA